MLIVANSLKELNFRSLMEVYREGNLEKAREEWPDLPENEGFLLAEGDFYQYLREGFFPSPGAVYGIWEEQGCYVSALRLEPYRDGLLLEAVETAPESRRQGYGKKLLLAALAQCRGKKIYSHVHKRNLPSRRLHEACGFRKLLDHAVYVDGSVNARCDTFLWEG